MEAAAAEVAAAEVAEEEEAEEEEAVVVEAAVAVVVDTIETAAMFFMKTLYVSIFVFHSLK